MWLCTSTHEVTRLCHFIHHITYHSLQHSCGWIPLTNLMWLCKSTNEVTHLCYFIHHITYYSLSVLGTTSCLRSCHIWWRLMLSPPWLNLANGINSMSYCEVKGWHLMFLHLMECLSRHDSSSCCIGTNVLVLRFGFLWNFIFLLKKF